MALEKIISISGQPGLYQVISQTKYGLIAENLEDSKRIPVYSNFKVSSLGDISIYTDEADVPLNEVFLKILEKENGKQVDLKSDAEVKAYFESILPTYDRERVYTSDMKKLFKWYNALAKRELIVKDEEIVENNEAVETESETVAEEGKEKKAPAKKAAAPKKAAAEKKSAAPKAAAPKAASKSKGAAKVSAPRKAQ